MKHRIEAHQRSNASLDGKTYYSARCLCGWTGRETSSAFKIADRLQRGCPEDRESAENKAAREKAQARAERKQVIEHDERAQAAYRGTQARRQALRETTVEQALADMTAREKAFREKYEESERKRVVLEENLEAEVSHRIRLEAGLREALGKAQCDQAWYRAVKS